jgi:hypothetical protein
MPRDTALTRFGVRFAVLYFGLYSFPAPLHPAPFTRFIWDGWNGFWNAVERWVGTHVFGIPALASEWTGNGDRAVEFIRVAVIAVVSVIAAIAWTVRVRPDADDSRLVAGLRVYLRFVVADAMLLYGISKVFPIQFGSLGPHALSATYGESAPEQLLWTFMAASPAYGFVAGALEMVGGLLLLFRRTTLLGALLLVGVIGNVVLLNFCYQVGVKLYASHLLVMTLLLVLPDARRLLRLVLAPREQSPVLRYGVLLKYCVIAAMGSALAHHVWQAYDGGRIGRQPRPLQGVWQVESQRALDQIVIENRALTLLTTDHKRQRFQFEYSGDRITLRDPKTETPRGQLKAFASASELELDGKLDGAETRLTLHRKTDFRLLNERFSWIDERPAD